MPVPSAQLAPGNTVPVLKAFAVVHRAELRDDAIMVGASDAGDAIEVYKFTRGADGYWRVTQICSKAADISTTKHVDAILCSSLVLMVYYENSSGSTQTLIDLRGFGVTEA